MDSRVTSGFGDCSNENWRDCHEDAAKSSHIGNQFRSGSCFTRQNTLEVDLKQNKCDMLFNLNSKFLLNSFKKWHKSIQIQTPTQIPPFLNKHSIFTIILNKPWGIFEGLQYFFILYISSIFSRVVLIAC